jgi:hypothetical protein
LDRIDGGCFAAIRDDAEEPAGSAPTGGVRTAAETELQFFARRAFEESLLAKQASCAQAAAAHSYLAAAYSAQIAKELAKTAELEDLLLQID